MLSDGVQLMLLGMAVVFSLLSLLVLAVKGMSALAHSIEGPVAHGDAPTLGGLVDEDSELVSAVTAAVHAYRKAAKH
jgi:oxaloacetate decarboxylase gamma subunit